MKGVIAVSPDPSNTQESAEFLDLTYLVSLNNSHLLSFRLPALCCKTP